MTMCNIKELPSAAIEEAKGKFEMACKEAMTLEIVGNVAAAFNAVGVVTLLREALTNDIMDAVFMPLMNTKIGFMTDHTGKPNSKGQTLPLYSRDVVRDCIIDAVIIGLLPTGNQFNILAERMYPTKEGYTALLKNWALGILLRLGKTRAKAHNTRNLPVRLTTSTTGKRTVLP